MMVFFVLSFSPRDVLDVILDLIKSVSEGFSINSSMRQICVLIDQQCASY